MIVSEHPHPRRSGALRPVATRWVAAAAAGGSSPSTTAGDLRRLPARLGRYELFDTVGRGGMADLYVAHDRCDRTAAEPVVIKEVRGTSRADQRLARLLRRESAVTARLSHPNIVRILGAGRTDGVTYAVLEYVEGLDLRELLRVAAARRRWPPLALSLYVVRSLLCGLAHVHRPRDGSGRSLGIVHRDVSPANVLLGLDGRVKLCDFGIAHGGWPDQDDVPAVEGKAGYMSPEQARGLPLDARSDLFAVGIMLWELCAARRMYRKSAAASLLEQAQQGAVPPLRAEHLPRIDQLRGILERALACDPAARYRSARDFLTDLQQYVKAAGLAASDRDLGGWLQAHFGREPAILRRRARAGFGVAASPPPTVPSRVAAPDFGRSHGRRWPPTAPTNPGVPALVVPAVVAGALAFGLLWTLV